jgi:branched-subunit amino acid ABC-type transport system permease component
MSGLVEILLDWAWAGTILALVAFSLGLVFGELKIANIAQGDLMMVGAYVMYACRDAPFLLALLVAVAVGLALGLALERGVFRRIYDRGFVPTILASWGVGIVLQQGATAIFSPTQRGVDAPLHGSVVAFGVEYPTYRLVAVAGVGALLVAALLVVYRTSAGLRLRASIDNVEMAASMGIAPRRMFAAVFAIATALAVLGGALIAPTIAITPDLGFAFLPLAFFAVLVARPGSIAGPIAGALAVQLVFTLLKRQFDVTLAQSVLFGLLALLVALRPQGVGAVKRDWRDLCKRVAMRRVPAR